MASDAIAKGRADVLLVQARLVGDVSARMHDDCAAFCTMAEPTMRLRRAAWSPPAQRAYVYCEPPAGSAFDDPALTRLTTSFAMHCPWATDIRVSPLEQVFDVAGASADAAPVFHYVVETDPEDGWFDEIARWYDTEHMPGLAAVPGCIRASRFINHGHGPKSLACYDLVSQETLGSPPWLAVRASAWSDVARPHFRNTLRTMFDVPTSAAHRHRVP